ncbi:hypothetical protein J1N35_036660, partial [Gossypium stocksii]
MFPMVARVAQVDCELTVGSMAPYKALYGRKCRTPLCWTELGERCILGPKLISEMEDKVRLIEDCLKAAFD